MYRYPTKSLTKEPAICTAPDCESKEAFTENFISQFRVDFVRVGSKDVTIGNDAFLQQVCTDCFLRIIRIEIERLQKKEKLH